MFLVIIQANHFRWCAMWTIWRFPKSPKGGRKSSHVSPQIVSQSCLNWKWELIGDTLPKIETAITRNHSSPSRIPFRLGGGGHKCETASDKWETNQAAQSTLIFFQKGRPLSHSVNLFLVQNKHSTNSAQWHIRGEMRFDCILLRRLEARSYMEVLVRSCIVDGDMRFYHSKNDLIRPDCAMSGRFFD